MIKNVLLKSVLVALVFGVLQGCGGGGGSDSSDANPAFYVTSANNGQSHTDGGAAINSTYAFAAGSYSYSIAGFGVGDKLSFPALPSGVTIQLINSNFNDGKIVLRWPKSESETISVELTGLSTAQDNLLYNLDQFKTVFGATSLQ